GARETVDVVDLVKQDEGEDRADAGDGPQPMVGLHVVHLGGPRQVQLQLGDLPVQAVDDRQVPAVAAADACFGDAGRDVHLGSVPGEGELLGQRRQVVLGVEDLEVRHQPGALADQEGAAAQQVAGLAHPLGVDVGQGEVAAAQQAGDLVGGDLVVLGLGAVGQSHVQGVADDQPDLLQRAAVGQPVPGEHAFAADHQVRAVRGDGGQEGLGGGGDVDVLDDSALGVEDAQVQPPCVQVDAGVES